MTYVVITLAVLAFAGSASAVWALLGRSKLAADAAAAATGRDEAQAQLQALENERRTLDAQVGQLEIEAAKLTERLEGVESKHADELRHIQEMAGEKVRALEEAKAEFEKRSAELGRKSEETFKALAADALKGSSEQFLKLATEKLSATHETSRAELEARTKHINELVKPVSETLGKLQERITADGASREALTMETAKLAKALSRPEVRGRYGEVQLRRVAELAGMTSYCDFDEQSSSRNDAGEMQRPDMVVTLPAGRVIAVDAKTNTFAYLEAVSADNDADRDKHLDDFARHVSEQIKKLADKRYWSAFDLSPEFVVMFVPGDHFIDAALQRRPELIERAAEQNVILASPSTLIGLLRAVAVGWREHGLAEEARELIGLGRELHERAGVAFEYAEKLGDSIRMTVDRYNKLVGSIDSRLTPTLKRFEDAGVKSAKALAEPEQVSVQPRLLEAASPSPEVETKPKTTVRKKKVTKSTG